MLVQSLAQTARDVFERELVEKNNDIRRVGLRFFRFVTDPL
jgi:hypothetical protein